MCSLIFPETPESCVKVPRHGRPVHEHALLQRPGRDWGDGASRGRECHPGMSVGSWTSRAPGVLPSRAGGLADRVARRCERGAHERPDPKEARGGAAWFGIVSGVSEECRGRENKGVPNREENG